MAAVPAIALTLGEPAGIGPEIALAIAQEQWPFRIVAIGDHRLLAERASAVGSSVRIVADDGSGASHQPGILPVAGGSLDGPAEPGRLNPAHARRVLDWLEHAARGCLSGQYAAMVTAPLHKGVINDAGIPFTGHTEFHADIQVFFLHR